MLDGQPLHELGIRQVADRRIVDQLEVATRHRQRLELRPQQLLAEAVALLLIERSQLFVVLRFLPDHRGERVLGRCERTEHVVLVHLAELRAQCRRRDGVADLPAGAVVGLAEAGDHERARGQVRIAQDGFVPTAVEHDVLVHLVGDQIDAGAFQQRGQRADVGLVEHRAGGVVRAVDDQQARLRRDGRAHAVPVHREGLRIQRHVHGARAGQVDGRFVAVVGRVQHDDLFARAHHRVDRVEQRLGGAAGHGDLGVGVHLAAIAAQHLLGDGLAQRRHARHRRVLVVAGAHGAVQFVHQALRHREIRKALPQVDRAVLGGELRHHGEDGGAHLGQLGLRLEHPGSGTRRRGARSVRARRYAR